MHAFKFTIIVPTHLSAETCLLCDAMKLIMTLDIIKAKIRIANIGQISKALQIMLRAVFRETV